MSMEIVLVDDRPDVVLSISVWAEIEAGGDEGVRHQKRVFDGKYVLSPPHHEIGKFSSADVVHLVRDLQSLEDDVELLAREDAPVLAFQRLFEQTLEDAVPPGVVIGEP